MTRLAGRRAVVTGAGTGIGRAIALAYAREGALLALCDLDEGRVNETLQLAGGQGFAAATDVVEAEARDRFFATLDERLGGVDILVNNAGGGVQVPSLELAAGDWRRVLALNLDAAFYWSQEAARRMRGGAILTISSVYAERATSKRIAYQAAKAGIIGLTRSMAVEWGERGIRANAVMPGMIDTELFRRSQARAGGDINQLIAATPLRRLGTPEDIAAGAVFLASDEAAFITGHVLVVDGGWLHSGGA